VNPLELSDQVQYYLSKSPVDAEIFKQAIAQTFPPFMFNGLPEQWNRDRPGVSGYRIHLGVASTRYTVAHEWSHVLFHRALFPKAVEDSGGQKVHFLMSLFVGVQNAWKKVEEIQSNISALESAQNPNQEELYKAQISGFEAFLRAHELALYNQLAEIEEIVVHYQNLVDAKVLELTPDEISHSAWVSLHHALELHDFVNDLLEKNETFKFLTESKKAGQFETSLVGPYNQVEQAYQTVRKQLFKHYQLLFPILLEHKLNAHIAQLVRKGHVSIEPKNKK
jgi:hypothetical protein